MAIAIMPFYESFATITVELNILWAPFQILTPNVSDCMEYEKSRKEETISSAKMSFDMG